MHKRSRDHLFGDLSTAKVYFQKVLLVSTVGASTYSLSYHFEEFKVKEAIVSKVIRPSTFESYIVRRTFANNS